MSALNLELKNIKIVNALSDETICYTASLYLDGKKIADLSNRGCGGCDEQNFKDRAVERLVHSYFQDQPDQEYPDGEGGFYTMPTTLETWTSRQLTRHLTLKDYRRVAKKHPVGLLAEGKELKWPKLSYANFEDHRSTLVSRYPGVKFVHDLNDVELWALIEPHLG
jgi:hypothetical protein